MSQILIRFGERVPITLHEHFLTLSRSRDELLSHPIYEEINDTIRLPLFMERHVFAVWDFMSLAKRLQQIFTCCDVPWYMPVNPKAARLINQIVLDEESDLDKDGNPCSHLELYLRAMEDFGCDSEPFFKFISALRSGGFLDEALNVAGCPAYLQRFVRHTLNVAQFGTPVEVVSSFLFGREDPLPEVFSRIIRADYSSQSISDNFLHYLNRHIQADAEEHGPAAMQLLLATVGHEASQWEAALSTGISSIRERIQLWDGILKELRTL